MYLEKVKNFGAANNEELKIETGKLKVDDDVSNDGHWMGKLKSAPLEGEVRRRREGGLKEDMTGNGNQTPSAFTLTEDTDIALENISLSPLAGSKIASADINPSAVKHPPEAGERGLKRGSQGLKRGFTLAEVLITLVVIGVVAAITIPVLHSNTGGKEFNAAKQKARAGLGEAFKLISVQNELPDITADEFARTVLPRYIKLAKNCTSAVECGFPDEIKTVKGTKFQTASSLNANTTWGSMQTTTTLTSNGTQGVSASTELAYKPAFFQTVDGFSVAMFYNPRCRAGETDNPWFASNATHGETKNGIVRDTSIGAACFSAIYDMNGKKGPNRVGDDIGFVGSFYYGMQARSAAVLPVKDGEVMANEKKFDQASEICRKAGHPGDLDLPTVDELSLIYLNNKLVGVNDTSLDFLSRSPVGGGTGYVRYMDFHTPNPGIRNWAERGSSLAVRCVRADKLM